MMNTVLAAAQSAAELCRDTGRPEETLLILQLLLEDEWRIEDGEGGKANFYDLTRLATCCMEVTAGFDDPRFSAHELARAILHIVGENGLADLRELLAADDETFYEGALICAGEDMDYYSQGVEIRPKGSFEAWKADAFPARRKYRVVLTCWEYRNGTPKAQSFLTQYESVEAASAAVRHAVEEELETLNDGRPEPNPFREDEDGDHANIIRFWDGDDYMNVTAYDIYRVTEYSHERWLYRGFIIEERMPDAFCVANDGLVVNGSAETLDKALDFIDAYILNNGK